MTDNDQGVDVGRHLAHERQQLASRGEVEVWPHAQHRRLLELCRRQLPCLLRAKGRGAEHQIWGADIGGQPAAERGGIATSAIVQRAVVVLDCHRLVLI